MNTELTKSIQERSAELLVEREQFVAKANQKLSEYAGRLAELEALFKQLTEDNQLRATDATPLPIHVSNSELSAEVPGY